MQVAEASLTTELTGLLASEDSDGNFGEVDFSETSSEVSEKSQQRFLALQRTVVTGQRYFSNCSEYLNSLSVNDTLGTLFLDKCTPEERIVKKARYVEIMEDFCKALDKDKAESKRALGSSSAPLLHLLLRTVPFLRLVRDRCDCDIQIFLIWQ